jgi:glycosyltransferase involved in cell wall biosynthesis
MNQRKAVYLTLGIYPGETPRTGAEVRAQQNLAALRALDYEITVITTPDPQQRTIDAPKVVRVEPFPAEPFVHAHLRRSYHRKVAEVVRQELAGPSTVLFCEHWAALLCSPLHARIVYSCHDLESELMRQRRRRKSTGITLKTRLYWRVAGWLEWRLLRKAARVICVSASEAKKIHHRLQIPVEYIPIVAESPVPASPSHVRPGGAVRLWFYGASGATSNKIMLDHLANGLFDQLRAALPAAEFHQLGSYQTYDADKIEWLRRHFTVHGFVDDLAPLFQRGDFCLIPYQCDTGFRTKIPEVCGYGMICAGYPATFACCPEMRDGYNCVIAESPSTLAEKLAQVAGDPAARERLAAGAMETRQRDFSFATLLEKYRRALDF